MSSLLQVCPDSSSSVVMEDRVVLAPTNVAAVGLTASLCVVGSFQAVPAEVDSLIIQELDSFLSCLQLLGQLIAVSCLVP